MNETIRLYVNITETRHNKVLGIAKNLDSVRNKILRLKNWISSNKYRFVINTNISENDDTFVISKNISEFPYTISFSLPAKAYKELKYQASDPNYLRIVLDYIYREALTEYKRIGERYNKRSSIFFVGNQILKTSLSYKYSNTKKIRREH